jgi:hypothetical protein
MSKEIDGLIDAFASKLNESGVPIEQRDNAGLLNDFESLLPKRLPQSFASFLSRYSFPQFDVGRISLFAWESESNEFHAEALATKGSLSELMLPAGYVQIGRPAGGNFDAVCFDLNTSKQNREYRIVQIDHEDILCKWRVTVVGELWPSFRALVERALSSSECRIFYEDASGGWLPH